LAPDKPVGLDKTSRVHLWVVPAPLAGQWCAAGHGLRLEQTFQVLRGEWTHGSARTAFESRVVGGAAQLQMPDGGARLALGGAQLRSKRPAVRGPRYRASYSAADPRAADESRTVGRQNPGVACGLMPGVEVRSGAPECGTKEAECANASTGCYPT
jgi:hypothetical protein